VLSSTTIEEPRYAVEAHREQQSDFPAIVVGCLAQGTADASTWWPVCSAEHPMPRFAGQVRRAISDTERAARTYTPRSPHRCRRGALQPVV